MLNMPVLDAYRDARRAVEAADLRGRQQLGKLRLSRGPLAWLCDGCCSVHGSEPSKVRGRFHQLFFTIFEWPIFALALKKLSADVANKRR
jgi:hypothetical protein